MDKSKILPKGCISRILSLTCPKDVCRLAAVCRLFRSAADADAVWESFLPSDYQQILSSSDFGSSPSSSSSFSKKDLFFHLCHHPILIADGSMSFSLHKASGKKCYMLGSRRLSITWGGTPPYWEWKSLPESRFSEVAELDYVWWLDVRGSIPTHILSPQTNYAAYFVYKFAERRLGFETTPVNLEIRLEDGVVGEQTRSVLLDPPANRPKHSCERGDGWMEIKVGEFFNEHGDHGAVDCHLWEVDNYTTKRGLILEGIELRPNGS